MERRRSAKERRKSYYYSSSSREEEGDHQANQKDPATGGEEPEGRGGPPVPLSAGEGHRPRPRSKSQVQQSGRIRATAGGPQQTETRIGQLWRRDARQGRACVGWMEAGEHLSLPLRSQPRPGS